MTARAFPTMAFPIRSRPSHRAGADARVSARSGGRRGRGAIPATLIEDAGLAQRLMALHGAWMSDASATPMARDEASLAVMAALFAAAARRRARGQGGRSAELPGGAEDRPGRPGALCGLSRAACGADACLAGAAASVLAGRGVAATRAFNRASAWPMARRHRPISRAARHRQATHAGNFMQATPCRRSHAGNVMRAPRRRAAPIESDPRPVRAWRMK